MSRLFDNHGRRINYVRLAVTDRCNLRCHYCMPEEGLAYGPRAALLTYEEMLRLMQVLVGLGIDKVRITGGEPFLRRDLLALLRGLAGMDGLHTIALTTNGTLTRPFIPELKALGIRSINLSLDTLDPVRFAAITRRDNFKEVWRTLEALVSEGFEVKTNMVVMAGQNDRDILPMVALTRDMPLSVRFIEEMPFNGTGLKVAQSPWHWQRILEHIRLEYPEVQKLVDGPFSTSYNYKVPGHAGSFGIIAAYSRTFCGTCNRLRITPQGLLKTCLYDSGIFNVKDLMRAGASDAELTTALLDAIGNRAKDGHEAESMRFAGAPVQESMTTIGG